MFTHFGIPLCFPRGMNPPLLWVVLRRLHMYWHEIAYREISAWVGAGGVLRVSCVGGGDGEGCGGGVKTCRAVRWIRIAPCWTRFPPRWSSHLNCVLISWASQIRAKINHILDLSLSFNVSHSVISSIEHLPCTRSDWEMNGMEIFASSLFVPASQDVYCN